MKKRKTDRKLGRRGRGKGRKEDKREDKNEGDGISFSITFPEVPHHIMPPSLLLVISSLRSILRSLQRETNKMQTMPTAKLDNKQRLSSLWPYHVFRSLNLTGKRFSTGTESGISTTLILMSGTGGG